MTKRNKKPSVYQLEEGNKALFSSNKKLAYQLEKVEEDLFATAKFAHMYKEEVELYCKNNGLVDLLVYMKAWARLHAPKRFPDPIVDNLDNSETVI